MEHDLGPKNSQGKLISSTKVKGLIQALLSPSYGLLSFNQMHKPIFMHLIS